MSPHLVPSARRFINVLPRILRAPSSVRVVLSDPAIPSPVPSLSRMRLQGIFVVVPFILLHSIYIIPSVVGLASRPFHRSLSPLSSLKFCECRSWRCVRHFIASLSSHFHPVISQPPALARRMAHTAVIAKNVHAAPSALAYSRLMCT